MMFLPPFYIKDTNIYFNGDITLSAGLVDGLCATKLNIFVTKDNQWIDAKYIKTSDKDKTYVATKQGTYTFR